MTEQTQEQKLNFSVDQKNLYREEGITDMKVASIRCLIPVLLDGSDDKSRTRIFVGHTRIMSPEGPLPLHSALPCNNLQEAFELFPSAMQDALEKMLEEVKKHKQMEKDKQVESEEEAVRE